MSFSNSSGGTLALPSPTHAHQIDVTSAVRTLRRSLSRSPSKFLSRTSSTSSDNSRQASPQTPSRRLGSTPHLQHRFSAVQPQSAPPAASTSYTAPHRSPVLTPLRASVKLSLRSAKSVKTLSPASRQLARPRLSPRSPLKRPLTAAPDTINSTRTSSLLSSPGAETPGQENNSAASSPRIASTRRTQDKATARHSLHLDVSGASQTAFLKALDATESYMVSTTGALKRSDATMNLDHPNQGSPVAKRRSLHGVTVGSSDSLSIFGTNTTSSQSFDIHEDSSSAEYELSTATEALLQDAMASPSPSSNNVPKRSSSLRKSTLQQRYGDKTSLGRRNGERQLANMSSDFASPGKSRPRLSTDHFLPPQPPRDSIFSSATPLPNASIHALDGKTYQPHPLSKTLTTSTSGNSLTEETSLYVPAKAADRSKPHPFSKSLPLNATRPTARPTHDHTKAVATPIHPSHLWIGAFNSTGLISKVNRNPEDDSEKKIAPPDTPCKKHTNPFATFPPPVASGLKRRSNSRASFTGLPSTPFNGTPFNRAPDTFGDSGKGLSIFQRGNSFLAARRGSILSLDGEDRKLFGESSDVSTPVDGDVPPTPTKNLLPTSLSNLSEQSLESPSTNRQFVLPLSAVKPPASRESIAASVPVDGRRTPQTPHEGLLPLDTSRLSLSQVNETPTETSMPPPVTPTTGRDFRSSTSSIFVTPVNARTGNVDIDASLYSKFDKVEQIGKGEFSTVYKATKYENQSFAEMTMTPSREKSHSPARSQVYAVKKSKQPYHGQKDREVKLREARILQALSHAEHVVHYVDDWEHNFHLYIQTEFCEEGTLEKFLSNVGRGGRLDDFRIFKILQDLCLVCISTMRTSSIPHANQITGLKGDP